MDLDDDLQNNTVKQDQTYKKRLLKYQINYIYEESFNEFINNKSKVDDSFLWLLKSVITPEKEELLDNNKDYIGKILISNVIYNFSKYLNTNRIDYLKRVHKQLQHEVADKITYYSLIKLKVAIHKKMLDLINRNYLTAEDREEFDKIIVQDELVNKSYQSSQDEDYTNEKFYLELCDIFKLHYGGGESKSIMIKMAKTIHDDDIEYVAQNENRSDKAKTLIKILNDGDLPSAEPTISNGQVQHQRVFNDQATSPHAPRRNSTVLTTPNRNSTSSTQLQKESATTSVSPTKALSNKENVNLNTPAPSKKQEALKPNNIPSPRILRSARSSQTNLCQNPQSPPMDDDFLFDTECDNQRKTDKNKKTIKNTEKEKGVVSSRQSKDDKEKSSESESDAPFHMSLRRVRNIYKSKESNSESENENDDSDRPTKNKSVLESDNDSDRPTTSKSVLEKEKDSVEPTKSNSVYLDIEDDLDKPSKSKNKSVLESDDDSDRPRTSKSVSNKKISSSEDSDDDFIVNLSRRKLLNQQKNVSKSPKQVDMTFKLIQTNNNDTENANNDKENGEDDDSDDSIVRKKIPIVSKSDKNKRKSDVEKKKNNNNEKRASAASAEANNSDNDDSDNDDDDSDDDGESAELSCVSMSGRRFKSNKEKKPIKRKLGKKSTKEDKIEDKESKYDPDYELSIKKKFKRTFWTNNEAIYLVHGVSLYGRQWAVILKKYIKKFNNRTSVNLKDKYRTLENNPTELKKLQNVCKKYAKSIEEGKDIDVS